MEKVCRDHLFISYAYEDEALAEWLTRKLTAEGYRVWCDRFKLLGGESYPRDIDIAIKTRTFRVLALLSKHSISKPNPTKERTLALNLARELKEDFLIPINVDGLRPIELDWMTNDLTFIPFENWAEGFGKVLKKLESINAPKLRNDGPQVAAETFLQQGIVNDQSEILYSNQLPFLRIPEVIRRFRFDRRLNREQKIAVSESWPVMFIDASNAVAFRPPTTLPKGLIVTATGGSAWRYDHNINGILTRNIIVWLLKREMVGHCVKKGLVSLGKDEVYFPANFKNDGKVHFTNWEGRRTWIQVVGQRSAWRPNQEPLPYMYHLAMLFSVNRRLDQSYNMQVRLALHITDLMGNALSRRSALARRKAICRSWWNDSWLKRLFAMCEFLADARDTIDIGTLGDEQIVLGARPIHFTVPVGINEENLEKIDANENTQDDEVIDEGTENDD